MRHGADGWWWAVCNEGVYKQAEPRVEKKEEKNKTSGREGVSSLAGWW